MQESHSAEYFGDTRRFFMAGGGRDSEFDDLWALVTGNSDKLAAAIANRIYFGSGTTIHYIVAGRKA
jgi:hypothetical protein